MVQLKNFYWKIWLLNQVYRDYCLLPILQSVQNDLKNVCLKTSTMEIEKLFQILGKDLNVACRKLEAKRYGNFWPSFFLHYLATCDNFLFLELKTLIKEAKCLLKYSLLILDVILLQNVFIKIILVVFSAN